MFEKSYLKYNFSSIKKKPVNNIDCALVWHNTETLNVKINHTYA